MCDNVINGSIYFSEFYGNGYGLFDYDYDDDQVFIKQPKKCELFVCEMGCGRTFTLRKNMKRHIKNRSCRRNYAYGSKSDEVVLRGGKYVFANRKFRK